MLFVLLFVSCLVAGHIAMEIYVGKEDGFLYAFQQVKQKIVERINTNF